jgi:hypothetical protein
MAAIVRAVSRAFGDDADIKSLKTVAMFCGVGLFVSLLFATYGLDLSPGFFDVQGQSRAGGAPLLAAIEGDRHCHENDHSDFRYGAACRGRRGVYGLGDDER